MRAAFMEKMVGKGWLWWPLTLLWAALIFYLSSIPGLTSGLGVYDLILRKMAHVVEYAVLSFFLHNAFFSTWPRASLFKIIMTAVVLGILYAISDEFHQSFVPNRGPSPLDVGFDSVGVFAGSWTFLRFLRKNHNA